jgi:hypothetical protein
MYVQLLEGFGWDVLKRVLKKYEADNPQGLDFDDHKITGWAVRYSVEADRNLLAFFKAWGLPLNKASARPRLPPSAPHWQPTQMA